MRLNRLRTVTDRTLRLRVTTNGRTAPDADWTESYRCKRLLSLITPIHKKPREDTLPFHT